VLLLAPPTPSIFTCIPLLPPSLVSLAWVGEGSVEKKRSQRP